MFQKKSNFAHRKTGNITIENIKRRLKEERFPAVFIGTIENALLKRQKGVPLSTWQHELMHLHYNMPEELRSKEILQHLYKACPSFIEEQVVLLEKESKLPWAYYRGEKIFTEEALDKTYLVVRTRLSDAIVDVTE